MPFPSPSGPNSYIWNLKQVYNARLGDNWPGPGNIGLFAGGTAPNQTNVINFININSAGNATDFGDLIGNANKDLGSMGSSFTRGVFVGGHTDGSYTAGVNVIQFVTFATTGNSTDFGDSSYAAERRASSSGGSNQTRGISYGGFTFVPDVSFNNIDFVTIATTGNATDFGDLINATNAMAQCGSNTRGIAAGGLTSPGSTFRNVIQFITIASVGNATDFGDLISDSANLAGASSATTGVFAGGFGPSNINVIQYVTIASIGNSIDFGDLAAVTAGLAGVSNSTRGVFGGGQAPTNTNVISFITIASTGNATDFGDLLAATTGLAGSSNGHGGLN